MTMNGEQLRADFEAWWKGRQVAVSIKEDAFAAYQAGRAVLLTERDALREALEQYADLNNWEKDEFGWRRIWREPDSTTPESYDGSELAFAALAQEQREDHVN